MKKIVFLLSFLLVAGLVTAQQFDLRVQPLDDGTLAVQMRVMEGTAPTTSDLIGDLTFGLLWSSGECANADAIEIDVTRSDYNIIPSMARFTKSGDLIQAFRVSSAPFAFPADWTMEEFVTIAELNVSSSATCPLKLTEINHNSPMHNDLLVATQPNITVAYSGDGIGRDYLLNILPSNTSVNTIETLTESRLQAFPNPAKDILNVQFDAPSASKANVSVYNVVGKLVWQNQLQLAAGQNQFTIDGTKLPQGTYLLNIISDNTQVSKKVTFVE